MTRRLPFIPLLVLFLLLAGLAVDLRRNPAEGDGRIKFQQPLGGAAPVIDLPLLFEPGQQFKTTEWPGRPYLVNFFASWCLPCHAEQAGMIRLAADHIPIIGIDYKDKPAAARSFLGTDGNPFAVVAVDTNGRTALDWGATGVPETWLIDRAGKIVFHQAGPLTDDVIDDSLLPVWRQVSQ